MSDQSNLADVLAECLEALERGEDDLQVYLDRYPQHREELSLLLGKIAAFRSLPLATPRSEFRLKGHQDLLNRIQARQPKPTLERRVLRGPRKYRLVQLIAAAALAFFLVSGGVAYASNAAVPGDMLYGLDRALERVRLRMSINDQAAIALHLRFAEERLEEVEDLVGAGDIEHALEAVENYGLEISALANLVGGSEGFDEGAHSDLVNAALSKHGDVLNEVLQKVPEKAQQAIQNALDKQNKVPGFLKEKGKPEDAGKPEGTGKPEKTGKPDELETGTPDGTP